jgi:signal recognition particle GTPase
MKTSTIALIIVYENGVPCLLETLWDENEVEFLEASLRSGSANPLPEIYQLREKQEKQDTEFGDYIEELLCRPFINPQVQRQGIQWLRSKIKIEKYQLSEQNAARIIAEYAYKIFKEDSTKLDFFLASSKNQVRIRVFILTTS